MIRAVFFLIIAFSIMLSGCRQTGPRGWKRIDSPRRTSLPDPTQHPAARTARPVEAVLLPDFGQTVEHILDRVEANIKRRGKKIPVIRIAHNDFRAGPGLDKDWITKHLRIELNTRANGRILFVDGLSDAHAEKYNSSVYKLGGEWDAVAEGFDLNLRLTSNKDRRVVWAEKTTFR